MMQNNVEIIQINISGEDKKKLTVPDLLALFSLTRCKLAEVETIDEIPCPGVGIDTVIIPGWDNQPDD